METLGVREREKVRETEGEPESVAAALGVSCAVEVALGHLETVGVREGVGVPVPRALRL